MQRAGLSFGVVALLLAAGVSAQDPMEVFNGVYLYSPSPGDTAHIKASIEQATANLGFVQRSIARGRLEGRR